MNLKLNNRYFNSAKEDFCANTLFVLTNWIFFSFLSCSLLLASSSIHNICHLSLQFRAKSSRSSRQTAVKLSWRGTGFWMPDIWRFLGFSDFSLWSPPWNNENRSCLNDIKFCEVSGNPKTSRFWKLQLSMSSGTQKASNVRHPYLRILFPFMLKVLPKIPHNFSKKLG